MSSPGACPVQAPVQSSVQPFVQPPVQPRVQPRPSDEWIDRVIIHSSPHPFRERIHSPGRHRAAATAAAAAGPPQPSFSVSWDGHSSRLKS